MTSPASPSENPEGPGSSSAFERLHPKVQRWIWRKGWLHLREAQECAVGPILSREADLLVAAATAAGKTEAAFLPICSAIAEEEAPGIRAVYIGPLKALINDQFRRLEDLCEELEIPVTRWHGDVSQSKKKRLIERPAGILLITPESLESVLCRHGHHLPRLFSGTGWCVLDELHSYIGSDRGRQLQSQLARIAGVTGHRPMRIGLSATLGDMMLAAEFLNPNDAESVTQIESKSLEHSLKLQVRGYVQSSSGLATSESLPASSADDEETQQQAAPEATYGTGRLNVANHLYRHLRGANHLVFANRREDVETLADLLKRMCEEARVPNEFFPHHGSLAKELREDLEHRLKEDGQPTTAVCTTTLEMGIDIGGVQSVAQVGPSHAVSGLRQRLGRSGRRGDAAILRIYLIEDEIDPRSTLGSQLRCGLVQAIATTELLIERWCEPPASSGTNFSVLLQQVLAMISERGGARAADLHTALCTNGPFRAVTSQQFATLLRGMAAKELIVQDPDGSLLHGPRGEKIVNHYDFYAVFQAAIEYRVVHDGRLIGTIAPMQPITEKRYLILAGQRWQIRRVDTDSKVIEVSPSPSGKAPKFDGAGGPSVHDEIRKRMRQLYESTKVPGYLNAGAKDLLAEARENYARHQLAKNNLVSQGRSSALFLCRGDQIGSTLMIELEAQGLSVNGSGSIITIEHPVDEVRPILQRLRAAPVSDGLVLAQQVATPETSKYDWAVDASLLHWEIAHSRLDTAGARQALANLLF